MNLKRTSIAVMVTAFFIAIVWSVSELPNRNNQGDRIVSRTVLEETRSPVALGIANDVLEKRTVVHGASKEAYSFQEEVWTTHVCIPSTMGAIVIFLYGIFIPRLWHHRDRYSNGAVSFQIVGTVNAVLAGVLVYVVISITEGRIVGSVLDFAVTTALFVLVVGIKTLPIRPFVLNGWRRLSDEGQAKSLRALMMVPPILVLLIFSVQSSADYGLMTVCLSMTAGLTLSALRFAAFFISRGKGFSFLSTRL